MKILITGINGFVGKILEEALIKKNHEVFGLDIITSQQNHFTIDITDENALTLLINKIQPEFIIHLAAISRVDYNNPSTIYNVNIDGTLSLLNACVKLIIKPKFLYISSSQVYGKGHENLSKINEFSQIKPVNHYGASKAACENIVMAFNNEHRLPVVIARPFNHTGKSQQLNFVIPKIVNAYKNKFSSIDLGNVEVLRDISDVRDVVNAYVLLIENFKDGEIYNISSDKGIKVIEIFELLKKLTCHDMKLNISKEFVRFNDINFSIGNSEKIRNNIGWNPQYTIDETLGWMLF